MMLFILTVWDISELQWVCCPVQSKHLLIGFDTPIFLDLILSCLVNQDLLKRYECNININPEMHTWYEDVRASCACQNQAEKTSKGISKRSSNTETGVWGLCRVSGKYVLYYEL